MRGLPEGLPTTRQTNPAGSLSLAISDLVAVRPGREERYLPDATMKWSSWDWKNMRCPWMSNGPRPKNRFREIIPVSGSSK